jgi:hypothetical protein
MTRGRKQGTVLPQTLEKYNQIDQLYKEGKNAHEISKIVHMTASKVGKYFREKGYKLTDYNQKHSANYTIFEVINTQEKAYWLGFLFADGSVTYQTEGKKRYVLELGLSWTDVDHVNKFKKFMGATQEPRKKTINFKGIEYKAISLQISSKKLCEDLISLGCTPNKSLTVVFPDIPKELEHHFIRGYFDGDGTVWNHREKPNTEIIGTKEMVSAIVDKVGLPHLTWTAHGKARGMKFSAGLSKKLFDYMYEDATVYLERKYNKFALLIGNDKLPNPNNG